MKFKCPKCKRVFNHELDYCETEEIKCPLCKENITISSMRTTIGGNGK